MHIHFPLLSILSLGFLLFFALQGGDVELHSIEVGFSADSQGVTVTVDPALVARANRLYPASARGKAFDSMIMSIDTKCPPEEQWGSIALEAIRGVYEMKIGVYFSFPNPQKIFFPAFAMSWRTTNNWRVDIWGGIEQPMKAYSNSLFYFSLSHDI